MIPYDDSFKEITLKRIAEFFGFHQSLLSKSHTVNAINDETCLTLDEWQVLPNTLFVIMDDDSSVGFLRIHFRGSNVAWIENMNLIED